MPMVPQAGHIFSKSIRPHPTTLHIIRSLPLRAFTNTPLLPAKPLPPRPKINEADLEENFLKGSGPGGQKINKTNSAVQLLHAPTGVVLKCQATRSRTQNRKIARQLLADKLDEISKKKTGEMSRGEMKAEVKRKKKASAAKKSRRKYRALDEGKDGSEGVHEIGEVEAKGEVEAVVTSAEKAIGQEGEEMPEWERKWRELRGIK